MAAGAALDMTLEDVIKQKGATASNGGGGSGRAGRKRTTRMRQQARAALGGKATSASGGAARPAERAAKRVGLPADAKESAVAPAAKAAAAAAKTIMMKAMTEAAAANKAQSNATGGAAASRVGRANAALGASTVQPLKSVTATKDKLQMSLDEVIKVKDKKGKPSEQQKDKPKAEVGKLGARRRMRLRGGGGAGRARGTAMQARVKAPEKSWNGGYSDWGMGTKRKAPVPEDFPAQTEKRRRLATEVLRSSFGAGAGWRNAPGGGGGGNFGAQGPHRGFGGGGMGGRVARNTWDDDRDAKGTTWSGSRGSYHPGDYWGDADDRGDRSAVRGFRNNGPPGGGFASGASAWRPWDRPDRETAERLPPVSKVPVSPPGRAAVSSSGRKIVAQKAAMTALSSANKTSARGGGSERARIRVSNVPRDLDRRDILDAFQDHGRVLHCSVERGVALITFEDALEAKKAVKTFDRGQLNGQTIYVSMD